MFGPLPASAFTVGGLHRRHGSLPWARLVRPSHELARGGVIVGWYLAGAIKRNWVHARAMAGLGQMLSKDGDGTTPLVGGDVTRSTTNSDPMSSVLQASSSTTGWTTSQPPRGVNSFGLHPVRKMQNSFLSVGVCLSNFIPTSLSESNYAAPGK